MMWNDHHQLEGKHALLSPSQYHWLYYTPEKLETKFYTQYADAIGTVLHQLASDCIKSRTKVHSKDKHLIDIAMYKAGIPKSAYDVDFLLPTFIAFVNDAIGFRMSSEIILYYSYYVFGTTDAIVYNERDKILRIHDLKSGMTPAKMEQLWVYAALYCLEYKVEPKDITIELRLYQKGEVLIDNPDGELISNVMNTIIAHDRALRLLAERG